MCAKGLGASNLCWRHSQCAISDHDQESFQSLRQGKQPESICVSWLSAPCHNWLPCDWVSTQYCNKDLCLVQNCTCTGQDATPASEMLVLISWHANAGSRCVFPQASCYISAAGLLLCYIQHSQGTLQSVPPLQTLCCLRHVLNLQHGMTHMIALAAMFALSSV